MAAAMNGFMAIITNVRIPVITSKILDAFSTAKITAN